MKFAYVAALLLVVNPPSIGQDLTQLFCDRNCSTEVCIADAIDYADVVVEVSIVSKVNIANVDPPVIEYTMKVLTVFKGLDYVVTDTLISELSVSRLRRLYFAKGMKKYARDYPVQFVCGTQLWQTSKSMTMSVPERNYVLEPMVGVYLFKLTDGRLEPLLLGHTLQYIINRNSQFEGMSIDGGHSNDLQFSTIDEIHRFITGITGRDLLVRCPLDFLQTKKD